ncbi:VWD domain-containing protein, partial [Larkinella bovis]
MKNFILFLCITLIFSVNSCKKKESEEITPIEEQGIADPGRFTSILVKNPKNKTGLIMVDSLFTEMYSLLGSKSPDGELTAISNILIYNKNSEIAFNIKVLGDGLIGEIEALSEGGHRTLKLSAYDFTKSTVNIQIDDFNTKGTVIKNQQIKLEPDLLKKFELFQMLQKTGLKGGRKKAEGYCNNLSNITRLAASITLCLTRVLTAERVVIWCGSKFFKYGLASVAGSWYCVTKMLKFTVATCENSAQDLADYMDHKCMDDPKDGEAIDPFLKCLTEAFSNGQDIKDYGPQCAEEFWEKLKDIIKDHLPFDPNDPNDPDDDSDGGGWGDPHLRTADGFNYDFQGFGEFILLKSTTDNFEIQARHEGPGNSEYVTMTTALGIQTGDDIVSVHAKPAAVFINNEKQNVSSGNISLKKGASISIQGGKIKVVASSKDRVEIDVYAGSMNYSLFLGPDRKGKVEGLLGNFDGNKENDLKTKEGEVVKNEFSSLYPRYADSWRVNKNFLLQYESGKNTESYTRRDLPKPLPTFSDTKRDAARKACIAAGVTGEPYLSNCTYDLLVTDNQDFIKGYVDLVTNRPLEPSAPSNDEYVGAIGLPINSGYNCSNTVFGTTDGATASPQASCSNIRKEDDVWFKFTATAAAHLLTISDLQAVRGNNTYRNIQVFEAVNNAPGGNILCAEMTMEEKFLTGLKVGTTYFVRVSAWAENIRLNFKLCVSTPPVPPANDEYTGAISLLINNGYNCANTVSGTTNGATASPQASCSNIRKDDDVWFKFTATAAAHLLKISDIQNAHGNSPYRNVQVFEAVNNAPGGNILCAEMTMEEKFLTGLKVGTTYFVRVSA